MSQELVRLGDGRAGHAGELLVEAEVVLEGDRGERLVLGLDLDVLLGLERLVQAFRVAPALHHAAGELVDDDHLVVLDDVVGSRWNSLWARSACCTWWTMVTFSMS